MIIEWRTDKPANERVNHTERVVHDAVDQMLDWFPAKCHMGADISEVEQAGVSVVEVQADGDVEVDRAGRQASS